MTQLDPVACDDCLARLKGARNATATNPAPAFALPAITLLIGLVIGGVTGFVAGRLTSPTSPAPTVSKPTQGLKPAPPVTIPGDVTDSNGPDESTRPGPDYRWVRGYTRKDGVKVKGHWARDPSTEKKRP